MVLKMLMVIRAGRLSRRRNDGSCAVVYDGAKVTAGGALPYQSDRARSSNHGDLAWATMQGIYNEPIGAEVTGDNGSFVEEFY